MRTNRSQGLGPLSFDNHDPRIRYYSLLLERTLEDLPQRDLPKGYSFSGYTPGDRDEWIRIEQSAKEFRSKEEGAEAWKRYYAAYEEILPDRMFFVISPSGEKVGTATAFFDVRTGDDHENGMLHWVAVRRDEQGHGLAKPLILKALQRMKELGYRRAVIPTQTTTWLACRIYLDLGFCPIPQNAEHSCRGWQILRTLTDHPSLQAFEPVSLEEILVPGALQDDGRTPAHQ